MINSTRSLRISSTNSFDAKIYYQSLFQDIQICELGDIFCCRELNVIEILIFVHRRQSSPRNVRVSQSSPPIRLSPHVHCWTPGDVIWHVDPLWQVLIQHGSYAAIIDFFFHKQAATESKCLTTCKILQVHVGYSMSTAVLKFIRLLGEEGGGGEGREEKIE